MFPRSSFGFRDQVSAFVGGIFYFLPIPSHWSRPSNHSFGPLECVSRSIKSGSNRAILLSHYRDVQHRLLGVLCGCSFIFRSAGVSGLPPSDDHDFEHLLHEYGYNQGSIETKP